MARRKPPEPKEPSVDIFGLPVLPAAAIFPMLADDELAELAEDIKANGLREPLVTAVVDDELVLVDGRNRREACRIAGIEPEVRSLNGADPTAYVMSANIHRRHMTKGQRAMATAMMYPEPEKGGAGKKSLIIKEFASSAYLSFARTVLKHSPEAAQRVLLGIEKLDAAYAVALAAQRETQSGLSRDEAALADLRRRYPELADRVVEGDLTLAGARAEAAERDAQRENRFDVLVKCFNEAAHRTASLSVDSSVEALLDFLDEPARRRALRQRAATFGCILDRERSIKGMQSMEEIFGLLAETAEADGTEIGNG